MPPHDTNMWWLWIRRLWRAQQPLLPGRWMDVGENRARLPPRRRECGLVAECDEHQRRRRPEEKDLAERASMML